MFLTLGIVLAASIVAGYVWRGSLAQLGNLRLRAVPVLFAALLLGLVPLFVSMPAWLARTLVAAANAGVLTALLVNLRAHAGAVRAGIALLVAGWALNAIVIVANGGMPLSQWAYKTSHQTDAITQGKGGFFKIVVAGPHTALKPLGDVIPIPPIHQVLSIGDLLLVLGIGVVVAAGMRTPQPEPVPA